MLVQRQTAILSTSRRSAPSSALCRLLSTSSPSTSSTTTTTKERTPEAYISTSQDPWFNLSLEHFLFTTRDSETPVCFLYRNRPCVVIGRNQNPWKELNAISMREKGIPFVRRRSGGGTVYHDLGNTNYSFHTSRNSFKREIHSNLIVKALNNYLFPSRFQEGKETSHDSNSIKNGDPHPSGTYVNSRNDICIKTKLPTNSNPKPDEASAFQELKISGSAYKLISSRAYHHGTMLLNASLDLLGKSLSNDRIGLTSKGVESFRSPVINLGQFFGQNVIHHEKFVEIVVEEFQNVYGKAKVMEVGDEILQEAGGTGSIFDGKVEELKKGHQELKSWDWNFGGSPEFFNPLHSRRQVELSSAASSTFAESSESSTINSPISSSARKVSTDDSTLLQARSFPLSWGEFSLKVKSRNGLIEKIDLLPRISRKEQAIGSKVSSEGVCEESPDLDLDLDPDHKVVLESVLSQFKGQRYDDFGLRCLSGLDFERDAEEVESELKERRLNFRKRVLEDGQTLSDGKGNIKEVREKILHDLLRWFKDAF